MSASARSRLLRVVQAPQAAKTSAAAPVLYWMSRDQRVADNWALQFAFEAAVQDRAPLGVVFCLTPSFPGATLRAYDFMLRGLQQVEARLAAAGVPFFLLLGDPAETLPSFAKKVQCGTLVTDFSPMAVKKRWMQSLLGTGCQYPPVPGSKPAMVPPPKCDTGRALPANVARVFEVDTHNTVPVWVASERGGGSRAIREKIYPQLDEFLVDFPPTPAKAQWGDRLAAWPTDLASPSPVDWAATRSAIVADASVPPVSWIEPGEDAAMRAATAFAGSVDRLRTYETKRIDPTAQAQSDLSPYFHFGHVSHQRVALIARQTVEQSPGGEAARKGMELFVEQSAVRPSICDNWCYYTGLEAPDRWPAWAVQSLAKHASDEREYVYSKEELEFGRTHDDLWNAAQHEMVVLGKMHAFLRMYWAKRILEWTPDAQTAFDIALEFNDKYELDGRDPNGITSIGWAIFGVHDAPFKPERPVTGAIRPMTYHACKGKFNIAHCIAQIRNRCADATVQRECRELLARCGLQGIKPVEISRTAPPPTGERRERSVDNPHHREMVQRFQAPRTEAAYNRGSRENSPTNARQHANGNGNNNKKRRAKARLQ